MGQMKRLNFLQFLPLWRLLISAIFHLIINIIGAPAGIDPKLWANVALALTIITAFLGNFFGYKFIVFKK